MFNTPILFTVFNRPDTVKKVFGQIKKIQPKQLFISADGPRADKPNEIEKCNTVRNWIISNIDWDCDVKTKFNNENMGCKYAMYSAFKWFFSFVEQGIILEDDCYPDLSFFPYCEELLNKYKDNPNIRMISGRNNLTKYTKSNSSYYFTTGAGIWGWATWKREMNDFNCDYVFPDEQDLFNILYNFTKDEIESKIHAKEGQKSLDKKYTAWDYQWGIGGKMNKQVSITPSVNMIKNIGFSPEGTHVNEKRNDFADIKSISFPLMHPNKIEIDYELSKNIAHACLFLPKEKFWIIRKIKKIIKRVLYGKN